MISLKNFAAGVLIAAICLAPAAWADAGRLFRGEPIAPALTAMASGTSGTPMVQAATGLLPRLISCAVARLAALQTGHN